MHYGLSYIFIDPQTPKWGLKSEIRGLFTSIKKFKNYVLKPPFGGFGVEDKINKN